MAEIADGLEGAVAVKVPIPSRMHLIADKNERSVAMRQWWTAYAARYPDYWADRSDDEFVYMVKRGGDQT